MFGRKRKKQDDGQTCPLCQLVNAEDAASCTRCYYQFTVAAHRQTVSELSDEDSGGLFDALMEEEEDSDDETPMVDWTSHSFSMDDMTVEGSPYDSDGVVEVDQTVSMDHQFDAPQQVARIKGQEPKEEEEEYVLTSADAPKNVEKFDTGDGPDLAFEEEEYSAPVVKLVEMTESDDIEPVASASAIPDESDAEPASEPVSTSTQVMQTEPVKPADNSDSEGTVSMTDSVIGGDVHVSNTTNTYIIHNNKLQRFNLTLIVLSLIHISEPTRRYAISYGVLCL